MNVHYIRCITMFFALGLIVSVIADLHVFKAAVSHF